MLDFDKKYFSKYNLVAGIDEAGRGPLAGPVIAAAVIFDNKTYIKEVNDSKKISPKKREFIYKQIVEVASHIGIGIVHPKEIDDLNILRATKEAMILSVSDLGVNPDLLLIDGNQIEISEYNQESIIKGDSKSFSIASASIIAKVTRDRIMLNYAKILPEYSFENHKGYGTKKHFEAIEKYKSSIVHRKSFNPVRKHLPSFNYYIQNDLVDKLLIQIAGDYLIKEGHDILSVDGLIIHSIHSQSKHCFYIKSNLNTKEAGTIKNEHDYKERSLSIFFENGNFNIEIDSI